MKKILCIGEALIDMICTDKGKPLTEGEYYTRKAGGAPTNVAAAIGALGGAVELAAKVGDDPSINNTPASTIALTGLLLSHDL